MGLLDSMMGAAGKVMGPDGVPGPLDVREGATAAVIHAVIAWLMHPEQGTGGVTGLVQRLRQGGLAGQVDSWIAEGANAPVEPAVLGQALGQDTVARLAQEAGLPGPVAQAALAQVLPGLIHQLTPNGQLPAEDTIDLGQFNVRGLLDQLLRPGA